MLCHHFARVEFCVSFVFFAHTNIKTTTKSIQFLLYASVACFFCSLSVCFCFWILVAARRTRHLVQRVMQTLLAVHILILVALFMEWLHFIKYHNQFHNTVFFLFSLKCHCTIWIGCCLSFQNCLTFNLVSIFSFLNHFYFTFNFCRW